MKAKNYVEQKKRDADKRNDYIKLICFLLSHIKDTRSIYEIFKYAQSVWMNEKSGGRGG